MGAAAARKCGAGRPRPSLACDALLFLAGAAAAVHALLGARSALWPAPSSSSASPAAAGDPMATARTFYDEPELAFTVERRVTGWDAKRAAWLRSRGLAGAPERVVMVSGSQPEPCRGAAGDHLLLRFLKNKADYCRLHGIELLYNRAILHPAMAWCWAKIPIVRAAMLAHPESEWVWWVDEDAVFTDMDFSLPLAKYRGRNFVFHGKPKKVFEQRSWVGLNAGVFLIRNCQWSLDFLDEWARMGPAWPEEHARWGKIIRAALSDTDHDWANDQSALVYLLLTNWERLESKMHIETEYDFQGYWEEILGWLNGTAARYEAAETRRPGLRRRYAEREHLWYAAARNAAVRDAVPGPPGGAELEGWRRPLITHFVGCQPCGGGRNPMYSQQSCDDGMRLALNLADDQVLRAYGFRHAAPLDDAVVPLPFDYPTSSAPKG
ncbi:hypothetical protein ACP4OV_027227 [Aristida adscensionis]